jgi:Domain of unknown function (DUF397)
MNPSIKALAGSPWRKSTFSGPNGGECVEIAAAADVVGIRDSKDPAWRKSTFSGPNGGDCVEVAITVEAVGVRDSKNAEEPILAFGAAAWRTFLTSQRA